MAIFISYRRADTSHVAGRLYDALAQRFGSDTVFKDVDSIAPGTDFRNVLEGALRKSSVMLVLIGERWDAKQSGGQRRLADSADFVRVEIEAALRQNTPVIPILADRATLPKVEDLPASISRLVYIQAMRLRADPDFRSDCDKICARLDQILGVAAVHSPIAAKALRSRRSSSRDFGSNRGQKNAVWPFVIAGALSMALATCAALYIFPNFWIGPAAERNAAEKQKVDPSVASEPSVGPVTGPSPSNPPLPGQAAVTNSKAQAVDSEPVPSVDEEHIQVKPWKPLVSDTESEREKKIIRALNSSNTNFDFVDATLEDVRSYLAEFYDIDILIDKAHLEEESIDSQSAHINLVIRGVALKTALKLLLDPKNLTFVVEDEVLKITTKTHALP